MSINNRFGSFKFGTTHKFGVSTFDSASIMWDVSIDWDEDGIFETNESSRMVGIHISRGRKRMMKIGGGGLESIPTGTASITLVNTDRRFDGWNQSSPLYPNVGYGKEVRIRVKSQAGVFYPLFYGMIVNIVPTGTSEKRVTIYMNDGFDVLRNATTRIAMQNNITPNDAIDMVLDSVGWKNSWGRNIDSTVEVIDYFWSSGNKKSLSVLEDIANSFLGYFYIDAVGRARYVDRGTVGDLVVEYDQSELLKDIGNPQPFEVKRDVTRIKVHPRTQATTGVLWQLLGTAPSIQHGNEISLFANYTYLNEGVPAVNVITPVASTDYLINSQADGSGTDLTSSCTVTMTDFGDTAKLIIFNNSGVAGYVTKLQVRGDAIYEPNALDVTYPVNLDGVDKLRELVLDLIWLQDVNVAIDISAVLGGFYTSLHQFPMIKLENRFEKQFAVDLFDIVSVDIPELGLTGESYRVGGIEHKSLHGENCQSIETRLWLEPYVAAGDYMQWDTNAVWNTSTIFGW